MGRLTLILGGQKSGKSRLAARHAAASGRPVVVVTPAVVRDAEFAARVARHQRDRPTGWRTVETFDLDQAVREAEPDAFVIVDALDTWLAEMLTAAGVSIGDEEPDPRRHDAVESELLGSLRALADAVADGDRDVCVIAGQPGLGVHAGGPGARRYIDLHGLCVQALSDRADRALLVVGGRVVPLDRDLVDEAGPSLRSHGDTQVPDGAVDLAVNVMPGPPAWLAEWLGEAMARLDRYPDDRPAREAAAARHDRPADECLVVNGACDAFWLIASALRPRLAACVHPSFTEPEAALRAAGVPVVRVARSMTRDWALDPAEVPADADLVVLGRPDNPTGALDPVATVERLCRPGRTVVVDEAFAEFLDDAGGLAWRRDLTGLVCVRSLTKLWGLAGLRVGYLTGPRSVIQRLTAARQPWSCNSLALTALEAVVDADDERRARAAEVAVLRGSLAEGLRAIPRLRVWEGYANYVLVHGPVDALRDRLLEHGLAARRADTFPGLDDRAIRVAVRDRATNERVIGALRNIVDGSAP
ncbi:MAG TPA: Rv2231c family pyridoxal phosphate-dependent protein CobC [Nocardioidaceae bacterium]|nr:Rv2231c family pyridoxal phosphate-dependent protein CobC [Nocardioidaceae bacterium]